MTLMQTLQDDFTFNGVDPSKWSSFGTVSSGNPAFTDLQLSSTLAGSYSAIASLITYDLTGSYAFSQVLSVGNQSLASWEVYPVYLIKDNNNKIYIRIALGQVQPIKVVAGVTTNVGASVTYNASTMKWFRIRESGGTIFFDYAADPTISWTNITSLANPFAVTALTGEILCGTFAAEASSSTGIFDNFNVAPTVATKKMELLIDDFEFGGVDSGTWGSYGQKITAGTTTTTNLQISSILAGNYSGIYSIYNFDLRGSYAFIQMLDVGNQNIPSWEVYPVYLAADGNNKVYFRIALGLVRAFQVVGGVETQITTIPYNAATMKWFRIRESGGTTYWDYAIDPTGSWTNITSVSNPIIMSNMQGNVLVGTYQAESQTTTAVFDNFNVITGEFQFAWSGYEWTKRIAQADPANNQTWGTTNITGPDANGYLTLNLTNVSGNAPIGCEIFSVQRGFGYGTYTAVIGTRLDNIDQAACFGGMFTFDFTDFPAYREIDMNETRDYFGDLPQDHKDILYNHTYASGLNRVFITNYARLTSDPVQTHRCIWAPDGITFDTYVGQGTSGTHLNHFVQNTNLPTPGVERVHFNTFVDVSIPGYATVAPVAVVIRQFSFTALNRLGGWVHPTEPTTTWV